MKINTANLSKSKVPLPTIKGIKKIALYLLGIIAPLILVSYMAAFWNWENGLIPKNVLLWPYNILQSPTPLWATILLIIVSGLVLRIYLSQEKEIPLLNPLSSSIPKPKIEYFPIDNLKWKTKIYDDRHFEVERISICKEHDLPLINGNIVYYCPESLKYNCKNKIDNNSYSMLYENAKSYIDKEIRNKKC